MSQLLIPLEVSFCLSLRKLCSTYSITVVEKIQKCLILQNCRQLNPNAPKSRNIFRGLFGRCKMRHLGQFSTTVTIIVILLAALLVMIVLQLSCLKIGIAFTKGIFGPEHFLALLKKCQVWQLENKSIIELDNACQAKVGQRTYKQLLVIIIILSLFSLQHEYDAEENWC